MLPNITKAWLSLQPSNEVFYKDLLRCITEGVVSTQAFEKWSKHKEMKKYVSVLEEWDDLVAAE